MPIISFLPFALIVLAAAAPWPQTQQDNPTPDLNHLSRVMCYAGPTTLNAEHCKNALTLFKNKYWGPLPDPVSIFTTDPVRAGQPGYILSGEPYQDQECYVSFGVVSLEGPECEVDLKELAEETKVVIGQCVSPGNNGGIAYVRTSKRTPPFCHVSINVAPKAEVADKEQVTNLFKYVESVEAN